MSEAIAIIACALGLWPSDIASSRWRLQRVGREESSAKRIRAWVRAVDKENVFQSLWWLPGGIVLCIHPILGCITLVVTLTTRAAWKTRTAQQVNRQHAAALDCALAAIVEELRVGAHPTRAVEVGSQEKKLRETPGGCETATLLREAAARLRLGGDVATGFRARSENYRLMGHDSTAALWERFAVCWELSHHEGIPMGNILSAMRRDVSERVRFVERNHAALAGARSTARILSGLPLLCLLFGELLGARPVTILLSPSGSYLLLLGCLFTCLGMGWSRKITAGACSS